jgi:hypothetical protein
MLWKLIAVSVCECGMGEAVGSSERLKLCLIKMKYGRNVALVFLMRHIYTSHYLFGRESEFL